MGKMTMVLAFKLEPKMGNKKERQSELKQVLLETMMLTNSLKEQLAVLNKKGINSGSNAQF